jgi:hypothetical protein
MPGLSLGIGGRLSTGGTGPTNPISATPPSSVAPAQAGFGPGGTYPTNPPSALGTGPGHVAIYTGLAATGLIGFTWWTLPRGGRNEYGRLIFTGALVVLMMRGVSLWGKVHVAEGQTQGVSGTIFRAASLL